MQHIPDSPLNQFTNYGVACTKIKQSDCQVVYCIFNLCKNAKLLTLHVVLK